MTSAARAALLLGLIALHQIPTAAGMLGVAAGVGVTRTGARTPIAEPAPA